MHGNKEFLAAEDVYFRFQMFIAIQHWVEVTQPPMPGPEWDWK